MSFFVAMATAAMEMALMCLFSHAVGGFNDIDDYSDGKVTTTTTTAMFTEATTAAVMASIMNITTIILWTKIANPISSWRKILQFIYFAYLTSKHGKANEPVWWSYCDCARHDNDALCLKVEWGGRGEGVYLDNRSLLRMSMLFLWLVQDQALPTIFKEWMGRARWRGGELGHIVWYYSTS